MASRHQSAKHCWPSFYINPSRVITTTGITSARPRKPHSHLNASRWPFYRLVVRRKLAGSKSVSLTIFVYDQRQECWPPIGVRGCEGAEAVPCCCWGRWIAGYGCMRSSIRRASTRFYYELEHLASAGARRLRDVIVTVEGRELRLICITRIITPFSQTTLWRWLITYRTWSRTTKLWPDWRPWRTMPVWLLSVLPWIRWLLRQSVC